MNSKVAVLLLVVLSLPLHAATLTWTNTAGGSWHVAANWQPNQIPGITDTALITTPGSYAITIVSNVTVASLTLGAASGAQGLSLSSTTLTITNAGLITTNGTLTLTGGGLSGQLKVDAGGQLAFSGGTAKSLYALSLLNQGTVTWSGGSLSGGATPTTLITNAGLWQVQTDNTLSQGIGGPTPSFVNTGTLRKTAGSGTTTIFTFALTNAGVVDVQNGTLTWSSATMALGGSYTVSNGATFNLSSGTYSDAGGVFSGAGTRQMTSGTLTLSTNLLTGLSLDGGTVLIGPAFQQAGAITNLTLTGATLAGTNRVGNGTLTVSSGGVTGSLTVQPSGQLLFTNAAAKSLYALSLLNQGTVTWAGGSLNGGATPTTLITNAGLWQIQSDNTLSQGIGGPTPLFVNTGTLRKTAGVGTTTIFTFTLDNTGLVDVQNGTLTWSSATMALGGSYTVSNGAAFNLSSGNYSDAGGVFSGAGSSAVTSGTLTLNTNTLPGLAITGGTLVLGSGFQNAGAITNLTLAGTTLSGTNHIGAGGKLTVSSGGLTGQLTVDPGGELLFTNGTSKSLYALALLNQGTVTWSGGSLSGGATPTTLITNAGLWQIQTDNTLSQGIGGPVPQFLNTGTLRKTAGVGTTTIFTFTLDNQGLVDVQNGTLTWSSATMALGGSYAVSNGAAFNLSSGNYSDAGGVFSGAGTRQMTSGTLTLNTNTLPGLSLDGGTLLLGPGFQSAGAITNLTLTGVTLGGTNRVGNGTLTVSSGGVTGSLTVQPGGLLLFTNSPAKTIYSLALLNQGTVTWAGGGLNAGATPTTLITNAGLWQVQTDSTLSQGIGGPVPQFLNTGTLRKTAGSGTTTIFTFTLNNLGLIDVQNGTLTWSSAIVVLGGSVTVSPGATFLLSSGNYSDAGGVLSGGGTRQMTSGTLTLNTNTVTGLALDGGTVLLGPGFQNAGAITNLTLTGATLAGTNRVSTGTLTVSSGGVTGSLTVQPGGQLLFTNGPAKSLYSLTLINQGTVTWTGGSLNAGATPTTIITNSGLWQIQTDNNLSQGIGGPTPVFVNSGTLQKTAGVGTTAIFTFNMDNTGLIESQSGTLQLPAGYTNSAGTVRLTGGRINAGGPITFAGGTLDGNGTFGSSLFTGGVISPGGANAGRITFDSGLDMGPGATLMIDLTNTVPGTGYDQLAVIGAVNLTNPVLVIAATALFPVGTKFIVITNDAADAIQGNFSGIGEGTSFVTGSVLLRAHYTDGSGNDFGLLVDSGVHLISQPAVTNGYLFRGLGSNFVTYHIEASTTLTNWTNIGSASSDGTGTFFFTDTNQPLFPRRFYRAVFP